MLSGADSENEQNRVENGRGDPPTRRNRQTENVNRASEREIPGMSRTPCRLPDAKKLRKVRWATQLRVIELEWIILEY
jgi:hypothetical protein